MEKSPIDKEDLVSLLKYRSDQNGYHLYNALQVAKQLEKANKIINYSKKHYDRLHDGGIHTWDKIDDLIHILAKSKYKKTVIKFY